MTNKNCMDKLMVLSLINEYGSKCALEMVFLLENDEMMFENTAKSKRHLIREISENLDNF